MTDRWAHLDLGATARRTQRVVEHSRVLVAVSKAVRESNPVVQCERCSRFGDGRGAWAHLEAFFVPPSQVS